MGYCPDLSNCGVDIYTNEASTTFSLEMIDPCSTEVITIQSSILTDPTITYDLYNEAISTHIDSNFIYSSVPAGITCTHQIVLSMQDYSALDSDVFTYDSNSGTLWIFSEDIAKLGATDLKLIVESTEFPSVNASIDFSVIIDDPCQSAILTIEPTVVSQSHIVYAFNSGPMV